MTENEGKGGKESGAVVITGASRGIGAATAHLAAERGFAVAVNYSTGEAEDVRAVNVLQDAIRLTPLDQTGQPRTPPPPKFDPTIDIVVVSDGSVDRTTEVAAEHGAHVVGLPFNLGIGGAVQTGFRYAWDPKIQQYAHASGIMVATPDGRLSHYFYGIEYAPKDLRLALVESSQGKLGNAVDQVVLYCYHYDPATGKYGAVVVNMLRLGGALTLLMVGGFLAVAWRRELRLKLTGGVTARERNSTGRAG